MPKTTFLKQHFNTLTQSIVILTVFVFFGHVVFPAFSADVFAAVSENQPKENDDEKITFQTLDIGKFSEYFETEQFWNFFLNYLEIRQTKHTFIPKYLPAKNGDSIVYSATQKQHELMKEFLTEFSEMFSQTEMIAKNHSEKQKRKNVQENQKRRNHAKEQPTKTGKVQFQVVSPLPLKNNSSSKKFQRVPHTDSNEYVWQTLGLRVKAFSKAKFDEINPCVNSNYEFHGAVQVLEIREDSLFYQHGLRKNDFLVGLITSPKNAWNITSVDDLFYVANYWKEIGQADFLAVRNQNLLTGKISGPLK